MIKKLLKDSFFHIQYWYFKECLRTIKEQKSLGKVLRYYPQYMKSNLDYSKSPLVLGVPWITFDAIGYMQSLIKPDFKVFEFGSGGSTRFFVERVSEVNSVEHDEAWYLKVKNELGHYHNLNLSWHPGVVVLKYNPDVVLDESDDNLDYSKYASGICGFPDDYFDLILVDGRARNACVANSLRKLKKGGYLILDNSNRKSYIQSLDKLKSWSSITSFGPSRGSKRFTQTTIYKKPNHGV